MSSSVFVETSRPASDSLLNGDASLTNADSNLVVVYGKNGINVDRKGLESLIDEKTLTSISVIRITSPTPSMQEEEAEEVRKLVEKNAEDDEKSDSSQDDDNDGEDSDSDDESKIQKPSKAQVKDRPQIVGLTVEEFYPPEAAKELAKEILKYAGVTPLKCNVDYEFQRYVIKNDHCYTPYTSPSQLIKEKPSADDDDKQPMSSARKLIGKVPTVKQYLNKRKILMEEKQRKLKDKDKISTSISDSDGIADSERLDDDGDEEAGDDAEDDESDYTAESEESAESDNDRDSDLDFDVNNRHGRKRKTVGRRRKKEKQRARSVMMQKSAHKRRLQSQDNAHDEEKINLTPVKLNRPPAAEIRRPINTFGSPKIIPRKPVAETIDPISVSPALPPPPPPQPQPKPLINIQSIQVIQPASPITPQPRPSAGEPAPISTKFDQAKLLSSPSVPKSPQVVKELDIHKVVASPKGGFTDLSTLLARSDNIQPNLKVTEIKPPEKTAPSPSSSSKGFMPLVIESAAKNQLPAQISIQTHQSSSEIAAENDKQSELIDSIVIPLEKSFKSNENPAMKENSIPDLVKMLERTEKAVLEKNKLSSSFAQSVEAIDIANAPLLETPDDEIPDDLLQHVVELMEGKSLQEAVEKEVLHQQQQQQQEKLQAKQINQPHMANNQIGLQQPLRQPQAVTTPTPIRQPRSIIEASISNTPTPTSSRDTTPTPTTYKVHSVAYIRKEPIQIVRGNGRVITLPPIEAPTTRAKRRAQAQPSADTSSFNDSESGDISMHSDTSIFSEMNVPDKPEVAAVATPKERTPATKATVGRKKKAVKAVKQPLVAVKTGEEEESQEDEDEDDPNKLWCICRQPHNNRFMICCDMCEDWFHGTCVSITKAMGLEMEQKGIEWTCPKCLKKQEAKKQRKITDLFDKKTLVQQMPRLDDFPKPQLSINTALEIQAPQKPVVEPKKSEPPSPFVFTKAETPRKLLTRQEHSPAVMTPNTPEATQKKMTEFSMKKATPDAGSSTPNAGKRIIVIQSTPKSAGKTMPMSKGTPNVAPMQQQTLKLTKVSTPAEKKQFVMTKMQQHAKSEAEQPSAQPHSVPMTKAAHPLVESLTCIVCKKAARVNSIYCSDDCIRKHAQNALNNATKNAVKSPEPPAALTPVKPGPDEKKKKSKGLFEDLLSMADRKPKVERVYVFERRTGKLLTGNNAPTTLNLKKWLQDNPTFEVVQPGSPQALEIEKSKQRARLGIQSPPNNHMFAPVKVDSCTTGAAPMPPVSPLALHSPPPLQTKSAKTPDPHKSSTKPLVSPGAHPQQRSTTPKHFQKQPLQAGTKQEKLEREKDRSATPSASSSTASSSSAHKPLKKQVSVERETPPAQVACRSDSSEPVRLNVRRTLKEQLMIRMSELSEDKRLSTDQVDDFVKATELEMYRLFNKDIGTKYKAKYRSLMFNIKDRKNETLFQKICGKLIEPRQLVRMSPEEMASQELAQWRENEAKHQLEMIKKSELDMLSCTKNYVLKTHKGEEVIESKSTDRVELDISIPVEDVVSVLNNSTVSSTTEIEASSANQRKDHMLELDISVNAGQDAVAAAASSSSDKKHGSSRERERDREKRHKSKDRHREKTRKRSRSRSRERHHKSSSRKDERREKEEHSIPRKELELSTKVEKPLAISKASPVPAVAVPSKAALSPKPQKERELVKKPPKNPIEKFNLIDQILESTKTVEQAANIVHDKDTTTTATVVPAMTAATKSKPQSPSAPDSDQEPSSTVSISTPPEDPYFKYSSDVAASIWTGPINMIDVASFSVSIQTVSGNAYMLSKDLPEELDVVGRISPDTVWDYIGKIKRSPNKEIVIIRLVPSAESENVAYTILYKYLDKRKRLGVIKTTSPNIKDFYIMPLGVGQQMPSVLHPTENLEFYEDVMRPDMLLGIVIRIMGKRHSNSAIRLQRKKEATVISNRAVPSTLDGDVAMSFTPPGSPKPRADSSRSNAGISKGMRVSQKPSAEDDIDIDAIIKAPITAKNTFKGHSQTPAKKDDADEPYSPGGSSDDDVQIVPLQAQVRDDDLKRKMDDINRRIEAQKMEIAGLLSHEQSSFAPGSKALAPSLANISIPSNLQQILASIQSKPDPPALLSPSSKGSSIAPPPPLIGSLARQASSNDEEYIPETPPMKTSSNMRGLNNRSDSKPSRLAQLSEAELLSMVPDDIKIEPSTSASHKKDASDQPPEKRPRWAEPPPPGVEGEYD